MADIWAPKDPKDTRDYWFNCAPMIARNATVTGALVSIGPDQHPYEAPEDDLTLVTFSVVDSTWVVIRVVEGVPATYSIHYAITDSTGQVIDFDKTLVVKERVIK